jgi:hypothetical protein
MKAVEEKIISGVFGHFTRIRKKEKYRMLENMQKEI